ncbi:MAG TPA: diaminopimelate decarboxylase [Bacillota bacterium]|nr:diaminopimelate decarboxylase [Bacillota bacterium]
MRNTLYPNLAYKDGALTIGGVPATELATKYTTPIFVCDEDKIRENCRVYKTALDTLCNGSCALYASKALSFVKIYDIVSSEGLGADVVSGGELYTALKSGIDKNMLYFHGNNKSDDELEYAVASGVGCIVANDINEAKRINSAAANAGTTQKTMLRVTPNIDPHTFKQVSTGQLDSKFGTTIETGEAMDAVKYIESAKNLDFCGCHCHIGSQIFSVQPFFDALEVMLSFYSELAQNGIKCRELDIGGGIGVRYTDEDKAPDIGTSVRRIVKKLISLCEDKKIDRPRLILEPGRSIVGDAGVTLYTAGSIKDIHGVRTYISVDGGMTDNPRYALYQAVHTAVKASNCGTESTINATVAGKTCESGDIVAENVLIERPKTGDLIAVLTTGAYCYSMASNYNRLPRPAVVMIKDKKTYLAVRRETYEDIVQNDII